MLDVFLPKSWSAPPVKGTKNAIEEDADPINILSDHKSLSTPSKETIWEL
jgi:hypothetical protein